MAPKSMSSGGSTIRFPAQGQLADLGVVEDVWRALGCRSMNISQPRDKNHIQGLVIRKDGDLRKQFSEDGKTREREFLGLA